MNICYQNMLIDTVIHRGLNVRAKYPSPSFVGVAAGKISVVFFRHVNELVTIPL